MNSLEYAQDAARKHGVSVSDIFEATRGSPNIVKARWEAWSYARKAGWTLPQIGQAFGRHHTSIMHGLREFSKNEEGGVTLSQRNGEKLLRPMKKGREYTVDDMKKLVEIRKSNVPSDKIAGALKSLSMRGLVLSERVSCDHVTVYRLPA